MPYRASMPNGIADQPPARIPQPRTTTAMPAKRSGGALIIWIFFG